MKMFLKNVRDIAIAGFFALLPVYVLVLIIEKVWKSLHSLGVGVAGIFGMPPLFGAHPNTIFTALLLVGVWIVFGLLAQTVRRYGVLTVNKAQYGRRSAQADVADRVRKMIRDNSIDFRVNSDTLGRDPSSGGDNKLRLTYTYLGIEHTVVVKEGGPLSRSLTYASPAALFDKTRNLMSGKVSEAQDQPPEGRPASGPELWRC